MRSRFSGNCRTFHGMRTVVFALLFCLFLASPSLAQTGAPTQYTFRIYNPGATEAVSPLTVPVAQVLCNQAPPIAGTSVNPLKWVFNDPANAGRVCVYDDTSRLTVLADGTYEGTAQAVNAAGPSAETARVPFSRNRLASPGPPLVPTGLILTR
jgi:hypothetical protein